MRVSARSAAVDAYIAEAKPFAQPILIHLRETMHRVVPEIEEGIKWSRPFFLYRGVIVGNMAAFTRHCSFGLWGSEMGEALRAGGLLSGESMGSFGKLVSLADLPPVAELENYMRQAAALIGSGVRSKSLQRVAKPGSAVSAVPAALSAALQSNPKAAERFAHLSPSCRREYSEWIAEAKREETRAKRVATAIEWIAEGKGRNWKYEAGA